MDHGAEETLGKRGPWVFVDEPRGRGRAAGKMERLHGRRTNHGTIGTPPCCRRWWVNNNNNRMEMGSKECESNI